MTLNPDRAVFVIFQNSITENNSISISMFIYLAQVLHVFVVKDLLKRKLVFHNYKRLSKKVKSLKQDKKVSA